LVLVELVHLVAGLLVAKGLVATHVSKSATLFRSSPLVEPLPSHPKYNHK
jgi:hypothetical protein